MPIIHQDAHQHRAIAAAGPLFAGRGLDGTTMADVAAAAGMSLKTLYAAFAGKAELIEAVLQEHYDRNMGPALEAGDALELVERTLAAMEQDRDFFLLLAVHGTDTALYARFVDAFELRVRELVPSGEIATALVGALMALARAAASAQPPRPITSVVPTMRALFAPHLTSEETP